MTNIADPNTLAAAAPAAAPAPASPTIVHVIDARLRANDGATVYVVKTRLPALIKPGVRLKCAGFRWVVLEVLTPPGGVVHNDDQFGIVVSGPKLYTNYVVRLESDATTREECESMTKQAASLFLQLAAYDAAAHSAAVAQGLGGDDPVLAIIAPFLRGLTHFRNNQKLPDIDTLNAAVLQPAT